MLQHETTVLTEVFSEVLSSLAFLFADRAPVDTDPDEIWLESTISYRQASGKHSGGTLALRWPAGFGRLLAANALGVDNEA